MSWYHDGQHEAKNLSLMYAMAPPLGWDIPLPVCELSMLSFITHSTIPTAIKGDLSLSQMHHVDYTSKSPPNALTLQ